MIWLMLSMMSYNPGPIDLNVTRIVIFDHLDDQNLLPMYRELVCFDDYGWVIGSIVVSPDASPIKEYIFTERFNHKRWRLRFQNQSYAASTMSSRQMFPKQAEIRFLLKESY